MAATGCSTALAAFASDPEHDVVETDRWREQVRQAFTAADTPARSPDSIVRAEDEDQTTASDATEDTADAATED